MLRRHACGNIRDSDIAHIWRDAPALRRLRDMRPSDHVRCAACEDSHFCSRCMGAAELETGDHTGVSQRACMLARLRKEFSLMPKR
jgi:radical SAM protein with 4Fe4S-binding SPASM domain